MWESLVTERRGKVRAVAKFPPPPHTGVQGRDGGAFWMTRGFRESPEKPPRVGPGAGTAESTAGCSEEPKYHSSRESRNSYSRLFTNALFVGEGD